MKIISIFFIISAFFISNSFAQSGRKNKPGSASAPPVQQTQADKEAAKQEEAAGYSESAPNAPRSLSIDKDKKKKKEDSKPSSVPQAESTPKPPDNGEEEEVIKVETNLVTIPVTVNDRNGFYVPDLRKENFKIFEDGIEQEIAYFGTTDTPFSVVLLIDVSPSTAYKIEEIQSAAAAFVRQLLPQDKVMVIEFDWSVRVLAEMTSDRDKAYKAIRRTGFGEGTSLYDAVDISLRKHLEKVEGRKAIVIFTDGVDTTSRRASFGSTIIEAEESEAVIFPIYYNTYLNNIGIGGGPMSSPPILGIPGNRNARGTSSEDYARGRAYLTELSAATGGKVFRPESTPGGLSSAFESIAEELHRQYSVGYYPANAGTAGQRKKIRVRVNRPKLSVRARDSYIVGGSASK